MKSTGRTVLSVTTITILARLFSLISTQLYLSYFGPQDPYLMVFSLALQLPNIIFTCIGTSLTTVIIPVYSSLVAEKEAPKAKAFLDNMITVTGLLTLLLVVAGVCLAPLIPWLTKYRATDMAVYMAFCLRVMMPVMFFYALTAIFQGILQSHGKFLLPAAINIPSSLIIGGYVVLFGGKHGVTGLLFATLLGLSLQAFVLAPAVWRTGYRYKPSFQFKNPDLVLAGKLALPALVSVSAYQINMLFNNFLAVSFDANTIMPYVQNIVINSILAFVYSATAVYYPRLTGLWAARQPGEYKASLYEVITMVLFFLVPAMAGFIMIRYNLFDFIARWGKFSANDVRLTGNILGLYALGIPALGLKEVFDRAFYAQKNTKTSAGVGFLIMGVNIAASLILIHPLGVYGMPLSYSISSTLGVTVLWCYMRRKAPAFDAGLGKNIGRSIGCALAMGLVIYAEQWGFSLWGLPDSLIVKAIRLFVPVGTGLLVYLGLAYAFDVCACRKLIRRVIPLRGKNR